MFWKWLIEKPVRKPIEKNCPTCDELRRQVTYLQGLVDRALTMTHPIVDSAKPEPIEEELPENISERIKFGDG